MSRWIDADRLLTERMKSKYYHLPNGDTAIPIIDIERAPSIDIVRCRECKYWMDDRKDEDDMGTCGLTHYFTNADDFCSYGCRKEE